MGVRSLSAKPEIKRDNFSDLDRGLIGKLTVNQWIFAHTEAEAEVLSQKQFNDRMSVPKENQVEDPLAIGVARMKRRYTPCWTQSCGLVRLPCGKFCKLGLNVDRMGRRARYIRNVIVKGELEIIEVLIRAAANPNAEDKQG